MDLNELRNEIDKIDDELVRLFVQRMEVSARIADYKKENDLPIFVPSREQQKLQDVAQKAGADMQVYSQVLYDLLFELSRGYQSKRNAARTQLYNRISQAIASTPKMLPRDTSVACVGTEDGTNTMIGRKIFSNCSLLPFKSVEAIFSAVNQGLCCYGILPLDMDTKRIYDLLSEHGMFIVRSFRLHNARGYTQYICIGRELQIFPGADRTTIRMSLSDRPGALYKVLARLYTLGINAIGLESRPITDDPFQAIFYFDLETSVYSDEFVQLICELDDLCQDFSYLGSYTEVV